MCVSRLLRACDARGAQKGLLFRLRFLAGRTGRPQPHLRNQRRISRGKSAPTPCGSAAACEPHIRPRRATRLRHARPAKQAARNAGSPAKKQAAPQSRQPRRGTRAPKGGRARKAARRAERRPTPAKARQPNHENRIPEQLPSVLLGLSGPAAQQERHSTPPCVRGSGLRAPGSGGGRDAGDRRASWGCPGSAG